MGRREECHLKDQTKKEKKTETQTYMFCGVSMELLHNKWERTEDEEDLCPDGSSSTDMTGIEETDNV